MKILQRDGLEAVMKIVTQEIGRKGLKQYGRKNRKEVCSAQCNDIVISQIIGACGIRDQSVFTRLQQRNNTCKAINAWSNDFCKFVLRDPTLILTRTRENVT